MSVYQIQENTGVDAIEACRTAAADALNDNDVIRDGDWVEDTHYESGNYDFHQKWISEANATEGIIYWSAISQIAYAGEVGKIEE